MKLKLKIKVVLCLVIIALLAGTAIVSNTGFAMVYNGGGGSSNMIVSTHYNYQYHYYILFVDVYRQTCTVTKCGSITTTTYSNWQYLTTLTTV